MSIEKVQAVFRETFEDDSLVITPNMSARDVKDWDSFNHINLIVSLETEFDLAFTTDEIASMANVGDLITILQKYNVDVSW